MVTGVVLKIWAWSVQPFIKHKKQTPGQGKYTCAYIDDVCIRKINGVN